MLFYRFIGLLVTCALCIWFLNGFGYLFGISPDTTQAIMGVQANIINSVAPVLAPTDTASDIQATEQNISNALPAASSVQSTIENTIIPGVVNGIHKLGQTLVVGAKP